MNEVKRRDRKTEPSETPVVQVAMATLKTDLGLRDWITSDVVLSRLRSVILIIASSAAQRSRDISSVNLPMSME